MTLHNRGNGAAFFVDLQICGNRTFRSVRPVFCNDNDVSLLPGETRVLRALYAAADLRGETPNDDLAGL